MSTLDRNLGKDFKEREEYLLPVPPDITEK
jgi:hypothetical protein